jgi:hypothetical protein
VVAASIGHGIWPGRKGPRGKGGVHYGSDSSASPVQGRPKVGDDRCPHLSAAARGGAQMQAAAGSEDRLGRGAASQQVNRRKSSGSTIRLLKTGQNKNRKDRGGEGRFYKGFNQMDSNVKQPKIIHRHECNKHQIFI